MTLAAAQAETASIAHCALCGAPAASVDDLVRPTQGVGYACDRCVHACHEMIAAARYASGRPPWPWTLMADSEPVREIARRYDYLVRFEPASEYGPYNVYVHELDDRPIAFGDSPESATNAAVNEVHAELLSRLRAGLEIQFPDR